MGFFDIHCQVSGVSSYLQDLEAMLMVERDGRLAPLSVLVRGTSNRLGGIDRIKRTALLDQGFDGLHALIKAERLTLDVPYEDLKTLADYRKKNTLRGSDSAGIHGFEWLFSALSYATWNNTVALRLDGDAVRACLAVPRMVDAANETIAEAGPAALREGAIEEAKVGALLDLAFDPGSAAREIHAHVIDSLVDVRPARRALIRLARLRAFLDERGGPRAPSNTQDAGEPNREAAEASFRDLGQHRAFRHALAALYPELFREHSAELDRLAEAKARGGPVRPYDPAAAYRAGEIVAHPRFGEGLVMHDGREGRVEIAFASGLRKLVCAR